MPVLAEPSIAADQIHIVGIARAGEYFPILQEIEKTPTLRSPFSRRPSDAGTWCKVQTALGQVGWIHAQPYGIGSKPFAQLNRRPPAAKVPDSIAGGQIAAVLLISGFGVWVLFKIFGSGVSGVPSYSSGGNEPQSEDSEEGTSAGWFSEVFRGREESKPKQGLFESHGDFRKRVYLEGKEHIIKAVTGAEPKQGLFEEDDKYRYRISHEANEALVERATGSAKQGFFEREDKYRERMAHEANEAIIEASTGCEPKQGFFEDKDKYDARITHEANECIIEEATGSAPKQGFFETDDDYKTRISQEAKDIKASAQD